MQKVEIFYNKSPIGYFVDSIDLLTKGMHRYVPYRNLAHFQFVSAGGGVADKTCACTLGSGHYTFSGVPGPQPGTLEVDDIARR
jgi:hypothetical protein